MILQQILTDSRFMNGDGEFFAMGELHWRSWRFGCAVSWTKLAKEVRALKEADRLKDCGETAKLS